MKTSGFYKLHPDYIKLIQKLGGIYHIVILNSLDGKKIISNIYCITLQTGYNKLTLRWR
jgi:hypothetical protein